MGFTLFQVALIVLLACFAYNSLANDREDDSIDSLIERLEHVLEIQARSKHELDDIAEDIGEDELESIDEEHSNLRKRSTSWNIGTFGGITKKAKLKKPVINSIRRLIGTNGK